MRAVVDATIRNIAETEQRIADQRARIARLEAHGQSTSRSEDVLEVLLQYLKTRKDYLAIMIRPLERD